LFRDLRQRLGFDGEIGPVESEIHIALFFALFRVGGRGDQSEDRRFAFLMLQSHSQELIAGPQSLPAFVKGQRKLLAFALDYGEVVFAALDRLGVDHDQAVEDAFLNRVEPVGVDQFSVRSAGFTRLGLSRLQIRRADLRIARQLRFGGDWGGDNKQSGQGPNHYPIHFYSSKNQPRRNEDHEDFYILSSYSSFLRG